MGRLRRHEEDANDNDLVTKTAAEGNRTAPGTRSATDEAAMRALSRGTWLWLAGGGVFAAMAAGAFYVAWPLLNPAIVASAPLDPACELRQGPCTATLPNGGRVQFAIEPRTIPLLAPLTLTVRLERLRALGVEVDFAGVDMNMGYNRPGLTAAQDGAYSGQAVLPVCTRYRMDWEAKVLVRTSDGLMAAPFRFSTFKGGG